MRLKIFLFALFVLIVTYCTGQKYTISGYITSSQTGEQLIAATVFDSVNHTGVVSNSNGFFSINLPEGKINIRTSYLGYEPVEHRFLLNRDTSLSITLNEKSSALDAVVVSASIPIHKQVLMGLTNLPIKTITNIPSFTGQPDLIKAITFIPGFSGGREGYSSIMVRGGDRGQNLILLDGVKLYNTNHLGGFVSLFNTDIVKQVDMYKGGFPARYGGRLSSVLSVLTRDGNKNKISGKFSIGLLSSSAAIDGPIGDKITFLLSARTSYFDLILLPTKSRVEKAKKGNYWMYNFHDVNAKLTFQPTTGDNWTLNFFQGKDIMNSTDYQRGLRYLDENNSSINIANIALSLLNDRKLSSKFFLKSRISISDYSNEFIDKWTSTGDQYTKMNEKGLASNIREISAQSKFEYYTSTNQTIIGGVEYSNYKFTPMIQFSSSINESAGFLNDTTIGYTEPIASDELSLFIEDDLKISEAAYLNLGIRGVNYFCENANYLKIEPRISLRTMLNDNLSFKANYTLMHQFNHVIINNVAGMEREIWLASSKEIPPQVASQWSAGIFGSLPDKNLELSVEGYYKSMSNLLEFRFPPGETISMKEFSEMVIKGGKGETYGAEFQLKYSTDKFSADLGYTLSWNNRQFDSLNNGKSFPFLYDRRHNLSLFTQLKLGKRYLVSTNFMYATGTPVTFPDGFVKSDEYAYQYFVYSGINNRRLPDYHRLDLALIRKTITKKGNTHQLCLNIFNVYARQNPVFIYYKMGTGKVYQKSMFSIIPSISYSFEF
jgi:hypothetical protein